jgi:hypothetical protein
VPGQGANDSRNSTGPGAETGRSEVVNGCAVDLKLTREMQSAENGKEGIWRYSLSVEAANIPSDHRLTLLAVTDDQGRQVTIKSAQTWLRETGRYELEVPHDARRLSCRFAYSRSQYVEFMVAADR